MQDNIDSPKSHAQKRKLWLILGPTVFIIAAIAAFWLMKPRYPLPTNIVSDAHFTLYYPSSLPHGYHYAKNSARFQEGVVFYDLQDSSDEIHVSEQAAPAHTLNLKSIPGFNAITTPAGNGVIGLNKNSVAAVIANSTTLITISGTPKVANDTVTAVAQNLRSL